MSEEAPAARLSEPVRAQLDLLEGKRRLDHQVSGTVHEKLVSMHDRAYFRPHTEARLDGYGAASIPGFIARAFQSPIVAEKRGRLEAPPHSLIISGGRSVTDLWAARCVRNRRIGLIGLNVNPPRFHSLRDLPNQIDGQQTVGQMSARYPDVVG